MQRNQREVTMPPDGCSAADFEMMGPPQFVGKLLEDAGQAAPGIHDPGTCFRLVKPT